MKKLFLGLSLVTGTSSYVLANSIEIEKIILTKQKFLKSNALCR
jgi:hypothetical protein